MAQLTLTYLGNPYYLRASNVTVTGKKNNTMKPSLGTLNNTVPINTESIENLKINVSGVSIVGNHTDDFEYEDILLMYQQKYDGSNYITLDLVYGNGINQKHLSGVATVDTVKVVLESFSIVFDAQDSKDGYIPKANLVFVETV